MPVTSTHSFPEAPLGQLERAFIEDFVRTHGYDPLKLDELSKAEREALLKEASVYASGRVTEVESRSRYLHEIHDIAPAIARTGHE